MSTASLQLDKFFVKNHVIQIMTVCVFDFWVYKNSPQ